MLKEKKAQALSVDLILAISMFIVILFVIFHLWEYSNYKDRYLNTRINLLDIGDSVMNNLVNSPGKPLNWTDYNLSNYTSRDKIKLIGLLKSKNQTVGTSLASAYPGKNVLDHSKIAKLGESGDNAYWIIKELIGDYDNRVWYQITFYEWTGSKFSKIYTVGEKPLIRSPEVSTTYRLGIAEGKLILIKGIFWLYPSDEYYNCGNDVIEGSETCDGQDLRSMDCSDLGYSGGSLGCSPDCKSFDTGGCT